MAHKKGAGSSDNGRDSKSKRLGVKLFGGQRAVAGNIIIRQRGTEFHAGDNVYMGRDHTLHAKIDGVVVFKRSFKDRRFVSIQPVAEVLEAPVKPAKKTIKPVAEAAAAEAKPAKKPAVAAEEVVLASVEAEVAEDAAPAVVAEDTVPEAVAAGAAEEAMVAEDAVPEAVAAGAAEEAMVAEDTVPEAVAAGAAEEAVVAEDTVPEAVAAGAAEEAVVAEDAVPETVPEAPAAKMAAASKKEAAPEKEAASAPARQGSAGGKASADKKAPKLDDLKIIEGVGPKIETLLKEGGISTWAELAEASEDRLKEILEAAGPRYQIHDPSTWPAQAKFAAEGHWDELKEYQDMLTGGRDKSE